jgi:hypothetical protein
VGLESSTPNALSIQNTGMYGALATAPPLPAPGRSFLDTLAFMQVYKNPADIFFLPSWGTDASGLVIREGLSTQLTTLHPPGASAPLLFLYQGNQWDDYSVDFVSNNLSLGGPLENIGGARPLLGNNRPLATAHYLIGLLRVQMQVAWCKSICLPNADDFITNARNSVSGVSSAIESGRWKDAFKGIADAVTKNMRMLSNVFQSFKDGGLYSGSLFPPLIRTQYGGFLTMYGFCKSVQIQWLPPFTPLTGHPARAQVSLKFARFFPSEAGRVPTRNRARSHLGLMG